MNIDKQLNAISITLESLIKSSDMESMVVKATEAVNQYGELRENLSDKILMDNESNESIIAGLKVKITQLEKDLAEEKRDHITEVNELKDELEKQDEELNELEEKMNGSGGNLFSENVFKLLSNLDDKLSAMSSDIGVVMQANSDIKISQNSSSKNMNKLLKNTYHIGTVIDTYNEQLGRVQDLYTEAKTKAESSETMSKSNKEQLEKLNETIEQINEDDKEQSKAIKETKEDLEQTKEDVKEVKGLLNRLKGLFS